MTDPRCPIQLPHARTVALWSINPDGSCACSTSGCRAIGKHQRTTYPTAVDGGYAIYTGDASKGSGVVIIDCDHSVDKDGVQEWMQLCRANGTAIPSTLSVITGEKFGRRGLQQYFRHPGGLYIPRHVKKFAGIIDVIGDSGEGKWPWYVVGPGSTHKSGHVYTECVNPATGAGYPLLDMPPWLIDLCVGEAKPLPDVAFRPEVDVTTIEGLRRIELFTRECKGAARPSVEGQGGHNTCFHIACRGLGYYQLPISVVLEILSLYYNSRCEPPWAEHELRHKVYSAANHVANDTTIDVIAPDNWGQALVKGMLTGAVDGVAPEVNNDGHQYQVRIGEVVSTDKLRTKTKAQLTHILLHDPKWAGVLHYDEFNERIHASNPPIRMDAETTGLSDVDITAVQVWFEFAHETNVASNTLRECIEVAARERRVHPVRDYLRSLPPGDSSIFDTLASKLFGASEELDAELLKRFLVGAVRRIEHPGTQMDTMLVLHGEQSRHKTQFVLALFGKDWASQQMPDIKKVDASQQIACGVWGQEIGELDRFLQIDQSESKDYLSRTVDRYRPSYGRYIITRPRQCVFIGTTNKKFFLKDSTGNRRYWPIHVSVLIDLEWLRANRDKIWAAAKLLADEGYLHHIPNDTSEEKALVARHWDHYDNDPLADVVYEYCIGRAEVTITDVFRYAVMGGDPGWKAKFIQREKSRIGAILRHLGAEVKKTRASAYDRSFLFSLPPEIAAMRPSPEVLRARALTGEPLVRAVDGDVPSVPPVTGG